jgi:adenosine deaminase
MPDIADLPKCELHLHLEGSLRPGTMQALSAAHGLPLDAEEVAASYRIRDFAHFIALFVRGLRLLRGAQDFLLITEALAQELVAQNVRYAEITTTYFAHRSHGIPDEEYTAGLDEGRRRAAAMGLEIGWIVDIPREAEPPGSQVTADFILGPTAPEGVVAIGCGGTENGYPPELFADAFARVRAAGLGSVIHAGEVAGPDSIRSALQAGRATRIGHGVRAVEDPGLVAELAARGMVLDVCPTSNVLLGVTPSLEEHPIGTLLEAGVPVTINTDDPGYFGPTLSEELQSVAAVLGWDRVDVARSQITAFQASSMPAERQQPFLEQLRAV